jgi:hypothetical protein
LSQKKETSFVDLPLMKKVKNKESSAQLSFNSCWAKPLIINREYIGDLIAGHVSIWLELLKKIIISTRGYP